MNLLSEYSYTDLLSIATAIFVAALASTAAIRKLRRETSPELPPGPRGLPLLGYLPFLGTDLHRDFERLSRVYGPIFKLWLGQKLCIVVSSPELVREVVREQDTAFANRDPTVSTLVGSHGGNDIAFADFGPPWKNLRKVFVRELMSNNILDSLYSIRREEIQNSIRKIYQSSETPINIGNLSFETATESILKMVCGAALRGKKVVDAEKFRLAVGELVVLFGRPNVSDFFPGLARFDLQGIERDTKKVFDEINAILDMAIEHQRGINDSKKSSVSNDDHDETKKDFLQFLLELHDEKGSITTPQLKALLQDTLVAGTDTTTTMVEWTMAELLKNPTAMRKVQDELTEVVGLSNMVEESHLSKLTYLNAAIKETHRIHPVLPLLIPRRPVKPTTLGPFKVPKHTKIFLNVYAVQRDPKIWERPLEFRPERFIDNEGKFDYSGNDFRFLPFGSGRRVCAGLPLAERMLSFTLASFLHSFDWKFPRPLEELDMSDRFGIVVKKSESLVAIPTPRLSNLELYS